MKRIGIDLGGTKIEGIVMDERGHILQRKRVSTPARQQYSAILDSICSLVTDFESDIQENCHVGMGTPGALSAVTGALKNSNTLPLNGKPIKQDLEARLEREVRIENDANCFALSEAIDGAGAGGEVVFGVIMGTGVGGGIVLNKKLHRGAQHIAGEWGHNRLIPDGRLCYCGRRGCIETYLSGSGLVTQFQDTGESKPATAEEIVAGAQRQVTACETALNGFLDNFGRALSSVINLLDPDVIVLGGGMSNIPELYTTGIQKVSDYVFNDELTTPIVPNRHGDSSGVRGAAWLWPTASD